MSNPQEKAKELVEKMAIYHWTDVCDYEGAKQCALIAVNEIIDLLWHTYKNETEYRYWTEVKQEIELL
jgi:hypothetical protein